MRDVAPHADAPTLDHVRTWVFDLDNTLYPASTNLFAQIDERITTWIADYYGIDGISARALQKHWYHRYGTSLNGLMIEDQLEPTNFLEFVHDIDHSAIHPNHRLGQAIAALPGRKFILTNGSRRHAENIAGRLGVDHLFEDIFDIAAAAFTPKPRAEAYDRFLAKHGVDPVEAAMFEDLAKNLEVPHLLGMRTVLVVSPPPGKDTLADWEAADLRKPMPHVDYVTPDLPSFLEGLRF